MNQQSASSKVSPVSTLNASIREADGLAYDKHNVRMGVKLNNGSQELQGE